MPFLLELRVSVIIEELGASIQLVLQLKISEFSSAFECLFTLVLDHAQCLPFDTIQIPLSARPLDEKLVLELESMIFLHDPLSNFVELFLHCLELPVYEDSQFIFGAHDFFDIFDSLLKYDSTFLRLSPSIHYLLQFHLGQNFLSIFWDLSLSPFDFHKFSHLVNVEFLDDKFINRVPIVIEQNTNFFFLVYLELQSIYHHFLTQPWANIANDIFFEQQGLQTLLIFCAKCAIFASLYLDRLSSCFVQELLPFLEPRFEIWKFTNHVR